MRRERLAARVDGDRVAVHRPAGQLASIRPDRVHVPVGRGEDELVAVVAVQVGERGRRLAVARQDLREAGQQVLVAMEVEVAPVLPRGAGLRSRRKARRHHTHHAAIDAGAKAVGVHGYVYRRDL